MKLINVKTLVLCLAFVGVQVAHAEDDAAVARGKELYETHCIKCHGATGDGKGKLASSLDHAPTPFNVKAKLADDAKFIKATLKGGKAVDESADMKAFESKLGDKAEESAKDILAYVKKDLAK